jgi:hypothetical protein
MKSSQLSGICFSAYLLKLTSIVTPILNNKSVPHAGVYSLKMPSFVFLHRLINGSDTLVLLVQRKCIQNYCS